MHTAAGGSKCVPAGCTVHASPKAPPFGGGIGTRSLFTREKRTVIGFVALAGPFGLLTIVPGSRMSCASATPGILRTILSVTGPVIVRTLALSVARGGR